VVDRFLYYYFLSGHPIFFFKSTQNSAENSFASINEISNVATTESLSEKLADLPSLTGALDLIDEIKAGFIKLSGELFASPRIKVLQMLKSNQPRNPPFNPREDGDKDQEAFWAEEPSISKLVDNLEPLMSSAQQRPDASSKMQSLPDLIKSSPFSMALAAELLEKNPNISVENLAEILNGI
jgi:hypothetical protein